MSTINFPLATSSWDEREYAAIDRVIKSDRFSMGQEVALFEKQFAEAMGAKYAVMVNSGSSANLLIAASLRYHSSYGFEDGAEVIVPAVSWSTTYFPLFQHGMRMKFVDIDRETLNYDLTALAEAIGPNTRAIMVVNLLGNPNEFDAITAMVGDRDIMIIEDNCESLGATYKGKQAGTFGVAGSYSSFFSHHIATMEGGLAVTDDEELFHIMLAVRAHGWTRNLPKENLVTGTKSDDPFEESFKFVLPGYNLRPLEMSGALGQEQIAKLPMIVEERRKNADLYREIMADFPQIAIQKEIGESSWFGFSMVVSETAGIDRAALIGSLGANGIECRPVVAGNFAKNEAVKRYIPHDIHGTLDNADYIDRNGLFIGNHHYPLIQQFPYLRKALKEALG
ncbi:CDP-6-deoxy-D-xylo-4-hexulose-3-dehydrase [Rhodovulum iodosum]|uniref:CDP-6-deoxy-D-xylo-4-hexulose-3-dehydrase n=1 Tax=Rhodovulum iodosum TaxID=68291 RepID=A0ABV3XQQ7_9RHOB|nr:DegT/DnrJ/EryC1/StrS family aminotransferase [Rhodovulum robiginosum]RSK32918.1 DegT/DnrJ/EryC1/StrS family aminotransferase [Rhodovulum robiginosum]